MALFRDQFKDRLGKLTGTQESIESTSRHVHYECRSKPWRSAAHCFGVISYSSMATALSRWLMFHKKNKSLIVEMWWEEYSASTYPAHISAE